MKKPAKRPKAVLAWGAVYKGELTGCVSRDRSAASVLGLYQVIRVRIVPVVPKKGKRAE